jgi:mevalonate kinase
MISYPAKCILSGEHTVLNGGCAIVSPFKVYTTTLEYQDAPKLEMFLNSRPFTKRVLNFLQNIALLPRTFSGILNVNSNIPMASGLGSSAAFCVAIANFLVQKGYILSENFFEVARTCENLFHGKSSGVDIAGVISKNILLYSMDNGATQFVPTWKPLIYVSYSGVPSDTKKAVGKVQKYRNDFPNTNIDKNMESATQQIYKALLSLDVKTRLKQLCEGINQASECFEEWGIIGDFLRAHQNKLIQEGALVTKPTGSGVGGHVLSIWQEEPSPCLNLMPLNL